MAISSNREQLEKDKFAENSAGFTVVRVDGSSKDFLLEVRKGNVPGTTVNAITGRNPDMALDTLETLWDQGGLYTYLTADTQLYVSSSNASDTAVSIVVVGLDENYVEQTVTATTNGQNQVALSGTLFRVSVAFVAGATEPLGDIYIAETDDLTLGVPDTPSKIKAKIVQGKNVSEMGLFTVPAGKTAFGRITTAVAGKGDDIEFTGFSQSAGGVKFPIGTFELYQNVEGLNAENAVVPEKTDVEFQGTSGNDGATGTVFAQFFLIENEFVTPAMIQQLTVFNHNGT